MSEQKRSAITVIGAGSLGGKAQGLAAIERDILRELPDGRFPGFTVEIPEMTVLATGFFDLFMERNQLWEIACSDLDDQQKAHAFQRAELPPQFVGELWRLANARRLPQAVRSSSLLEDAMFRPFAGVYATKMIPNQAPDEQSRFNGLVEAIKFVIASTFFQDAQRYILSVGKDLREEKMAVIIQDVVGQRYGDRFYPTLSGVARTWNFYPAGRSKPEDGVVDLALGLGKTIVDGGKVWSYSPAAPSSPPPFNNVGDLMRNTQTRFWAVHMGAPPPYDPLKQDEHLVQHPLKEADYDDTLRFVASTYDRTCDRIIPTVGISGPRILDFAPALILERLKLNEVLRELMAISKQSAGTDVEVELAAVLDRKEGTPARIGFLQVRPMVVSEGGAEVSSEALDDPLAIVTSEMALGNGATDNIRDIIYIDPGTFDASKTAEIAQQIERWNKRLVAEKRPYLLIGFGRWGTSDPWYGIPCVWSQIAGASVIVEVAFPGMETDMSQGSHFFHNITSFKVFYLSVPRRGRTRVDWTWLGAQKEVVRHGVLRHIQTSEPLHVQVDGRSGRGVILRKQA